MEELSIKEFIFSYIYESNSVRNSIDILKVINLANELIRVLKNNGKLILFGNGGSAAEAQHIATEFVGRFEKERKALPAIALTTNTSTLTAIGNDYSYDDVFERQLEAFMNQNDLVIGLSTSGNSMNVVKALTYAKERGVKIAAITGENGGKLKDIVPEELLIRVPSTRTSIIQETSLMIGHIISKIVEDSI